MGQFMLTAFFKPIIEKTINGGSSLISDQLLKVMFREENNRKNEILLQNFDRELEKIWALPIMEPQNRRILEELMAEYKKQRDLLNKHKQLPAESHEENGQQAVTVSAPFDIIKSLFSGNVQDDIEWFIKQAEKLFTQVTESANQIRQNPRRMPLVRQLIKKELIYIVYSTGQGSQKRKCVIWPFYLQVRGVEAVLHFEYSDSITPSKSFTLDLFLRLRESTDIVGIVMRCFKLIPSQLNHVREFAKCELDQLAKLHGDFRSHEDWYSKSEASHYRAITMKYRPDSFCCAADADELPEEISYFNFNCHVSGAVNDNVASSSNDARPPLKLDLNFAPHVLSRDQQMLVGMAGKGKHDVSTLQQFLENIGHNATKHFVHQQQFTKQTSIWFINHGFVRVEVSKSTI